MGEIVLNFLAFLELYEYMTKWNYLFKLRNLSNSFFLTKTIKVLSRALFLSKYFLTFFCFLMCALLRWAHKIIRRKKKRVAFLFAKHSITWLTPPASYAHFHNVVEKNFGVAFQQLQVLHLLWIYSKVTKTIIIIQ